MSIINNSFRPLPLVGSLAGQTTATGTRAVPGDNPWAVADDFDKIPCTTGQTATPYDRPGNLEEARKNGEVAVEALTHLGFLNMAEDRLGGGDTRY